MIATGHRQHAVDRGLERDLPVDAVALAAQLTHPSQVHGVVPVDADEARLKRSLAQAGDARRGAGVIFVTTVTGITSCSHEPALA